MEFQPILDEIPGIGGSCPLTGSASGLLRGRGNKKSDHA